MESGIPEYDIIEPYLRADGTHAWARTNKVPLRDTEGNVIGVLGTYEDITEHKRAEEQIKIALAEKEMLLREINHRVKNNLTAIMGLLYTAQRHASGDEQVTYQSVMNDLIGRIFGLSTVHNMLSASEWKPLRLSDLMAQIIDASLDALPRDKRVSVDVSPSPVHVTADQAHNLALVVNELATNAIKYALRERDTASITVRIAVENNEAGHTVCCEFRDDGPGFPEEVLRLERHGVGWELIQNIIGRGLRGEVSLHNDQGAVTVVRFPVAA